MAYLIPADKSTHAILGALVTLLLLLFGWPWALGGCAAVAIGREVHGWRKRGYRMNRADAAEHALDIGATLAGGAVVLLSAFIGAAL